MKKYYSLMHIATFIRLVQRLVTSIAITSFACVILAAMLPVKLFGQAPTVSYSSPQTYPLNTAITPLSPASTGVASPAYSGSVTTINTGIANPYGVATDAAGNLYISDINNQVVKELPSDGSSPVIIGSGQFNKPQGITVDAAGNVYAADANFAAVREILKSDGSGHSLGTGFNELSGVAVDAAGNVYVADFGSANPVKKILKSDGSTTFIGTGFSNYVIAVATDASGNVYVADWGGGNIDEIFASNGNTTTLVSGLSHPQGVAVDPIGNVFFSDAGNGAIKELPVTGGGPVTLVSGLTNPGQVAVDGSGNIYFADTTNGTVQEIKPVGGYYISTSLPAGLTFSGTTGVISGTTTSVSSGPSNYTITAYNTSGHASATISITVGNPPAPTLSYAGPKTYTTGFAVSPLSPSSAGVATPAYSSSPVTYGTGYNSDQGVATDAAGNVYVTDYYNNAIDKIPAGGGSQTTVVSGLNGPVGIAVDAAGNIYVAESAANTVLKIPGGTGTPVVIGTGFNNPTSVAVDAAGNVYVADFSNNAIKEIMASDGSTVQVGSGFSNPFGVAVDAYNNVYLSELYKGNVKKIPADGGAIVTLASAFGGPQGIAVDAAGNIFVADSGGKRLKEIPVGGGAVTIIGSGYIYPDGVAADGSGNVYFADGHNAVFQFKPVGGYYINKALPAGLNFNGATGVIAGTPTAVNAPKDYTVTGYNSTGNAKATVNLQVVAPANIISATRSYAQNPTNGYYLTYTVVFSAPVTGLIPSNFSLTTTGNITGASINSVSGPGPSYSVNIVSGSGDGNITLNLANGIGLEPGIITSLPFVGQVYTIDKTAPTVTIGSPSVSAISPGAGSVTYAVSYADANFNTSTLTTANIILNTPGTASGTVGVTGSGTNYTVTVSNITGNGALGISIASGTATDRAGNTAPAGGPSATFAVTPATSSNYDMSNITASSGSLSPSFSNGIRDYVVKVSNSTSSITITPTASDANATLTLNDLNPVAGMVSNDQTVASGTASKSILLNSDTTKLYIEITAPNNTDYNIYYLDIVRAAPSSIPSATTFVQTAVTSSSAILNGNANDNGSATTVSFTYSVNSNLSGGNTAAATTGGYLIAGTGNTNAALTLTGLAPLTKYYYQITAINSFGTTKGIILSFTTQSGSVSNNAGIASLVLSPAALLTQVPYTNNLTTSVSSATTSVTLTPTARDNTATIMVNGAHVASGSASQSIPLNVTGTTTVTTIVTAQDGVTKQTYTITIKKAPSNNANIASLVLNPAEVLTQVPYTNNYTTSVSMATNAVTLTPTARDNTATITVNGLTLVSGTPSQSIPLNATGTTTITTIVTAQDGVTKQTFAVTISKAGSNNDNIASLVLTPYTKLTQTPYSNNFTANVTSGTSSVTLTPTARDNTASITVDGTPVVSGTPSQSIPLVTGTNNITTVVTAQDGVTKQTFVIAVTRVPASVNSIYVQSETRSPEISTIGNEKIEANNILSPNGDGINDTWVVKNIVFYPNNMVTVYDRSGRVVFNKKGYANDWDGTYRGSVLNEGTYYYLVDLGNGTSSKGFITVVRDR